MWAGFNFGYLFLQQYKAMIKLESYLPTHLVKIVKLV